MTVDDREIKRIFKEAKTSLSSMAEDLPISRSTFSQVINGHHRIQRRHANLLAPQIEGVEPRYIMATWLIAYALDEAREIKEKAKSDDHERTLNKAEEEIYNLEAMTAQTSFEFDRESEIWSQLSRIRRSIHNEFVEVATLNGTDLHTNRAKQTEIFQDNEK